MKDEMRIVDQYQGEYETVLPDIDRDFEGLKIQFELIERNLKNKR